jgi:hypothetical protein
MAAVYLDVHVVGGLRTGLQQLPRASIRHHVRMRALYMCMFQDPIYKQT